MNQYRLWTYGPRYVACGGQRNIVVLRGGASVLNPYRNDFHQPGPKIKSPPNCAMFPCLPMCFGCVTARCFRCGICIELGNYSTYPHARHHVHEHATWEVAFLLLPPWRSIEGDFEVECSEYCPGRVCVDVSLETSRFWVVAGSVRFNLEAEHVFPYLCRMGLHPTPHIQ